MKQTLSCSAGLGLILVAATVMAGGVAGPKHSGINVPASKTGEPGEISFKQEFKAGKRASIVVIGDHRPVVDLKIQVFDDSTGKPVAQDGGGGDVIGVSWIPPRKGIYRIVLQNPSKFVEVKNPHNECTIAIN